MSESRTIVGLDLSLTGTGVVIVDDADLVRTRLIETKGHRADTLAQRHARLCTIRAAIHHLVPQRTAMVLIEGPALGAMGGSMHDRSGLWWMITDLLLDLGHKVVEVVPQARMRYATGKGSAKKDVVLAAAIKRYPHVEIIDNNIADAMVLAGMGRRAILHPIDDMPQAHWLAMDKVRWP
jgi:crossover junction endodeoxyribonuclease RuvC